jgi:hypothetical protein
MNNNIIDDYDDQGHPCYPSKANGKTWVKTTRHDIN